MVPLLILTALVVSCASVPAPVPRAPSLTPEQVVTLFSESYGTADMDRIGPYTTARFRDGRPITVWIIDVWDELNELEYETLAFTILETQFNETKDEAQVACTAEIQTTAGTSEQKETYLLILKDNRWLIDELYVTDEKVTGEGMKL